MRLLPLLLLFVYCSVSAKWLPIAWSEERDALWEYDPKRLKRSGDKVSLWIKATGEKHKENIKRVYVGRPQKVAEVEHKFSYSLIQFEIKCLNMEYKLIGGADYDSTGVPFDDPYPTSSFRSIPPESFIETTAFQLCDAKYKK